MYKRIAKRIERHEREEKLGITEEEKEILGLQDTDTEESESDDLEEEERDSDDDNEDDDAAGSEGSIAGETANEEDGDEEGSEEDNDAESISDLIPPISISQALQSPLYRFLGDTKSEGCAVCPGKILATRNAAELHANSSSHKRRLKRFQNYLNEAKEKGEDLSELDASVVVLRMDEAAPKPTPQRETKSQPNAKKTGPKPPNRKMRRAALRKAMAEEKKGKENDKSPDGAAKEQPPSTEKASKPRSGPQVKETSSEKTVHEVDLRTKKKRKQPSEQTADKPKKKKTKPVVA